MLLSITHRKIYMDQGGPRQLTVQKDYAWKWKNSRYLPRILNQDEENYWRMDLQATRYKPSCTLGNLTYSMFILES